MITCIHRGLPALILAFLASAALGQGIIIDRRPHIPVTGTYVVKQLAIDASVQDQVAQVQVTQEFHNPSSRDLEVEYLFPLPADGALQNLVLIVDGKEMPGRLLPAEEARRIYESIVRARKDPALLEWAGQGLYKTSVFPVAAGKSVKVVMKYTQLLKRDRDRVEFAYPLGSHKLTGKPIAELTIHLSLQTREPIKALYSPSHDPQITRTGDRNATVKLTLRDVASTGDFRLFCNLNDQKVGATLLSWKPASGEDGYFMLLASPGFTRPDARPSAKTVVFVIDKSGSMSGQKITQARNAAKFVLNNTLNEGDLFNLVVYDDVVTTFKPELQALGKETREQALAFVDNIREGGSTNIDQALRTALEMLKDDSRPNYVLFLTDGLPTAGEQNEMKIADNAAKTNKVKARLVAFGVGYDVNARLLDRLSGSNGGVSEYIKPTENLEDAVSRFASRLTSPVLAGIDITLSGTEINRAYPRSVPDLFEGGQLVWVGRYTRGGDATVKINGKIDGKPQSFAYACSLAGENQGAAYQFIERLWAVRRVGHLIDQIDLQGRNAELVSELVALSTKYGILTPYTSFLADENVSLAATRENTDLAMRRTEALAETSGAGGQAQRALKSGYAQANLAPAAATPVALDTLGKAREVQSVRNVGNRTFYRKDSRWVQSDLSDRRRDQAIQIKQYSDEYFELTRRLAPAENQYLANFNESLLVELEGKVYEISP